LLNFWSIRSLWVMILRSSKFLSLVFFVGSRTFNSYTPTLSSRFCRLCGILWKLWNIVVRPPKRGLVSRPCFRTSFPLSLLELIGVDAFCFGRFENSTKFASRFCQNSQIGNLQIRTQNVSNSHRSRDNELFWIRWGKLSKILIFCFDNFVPANCDLFLFLQLLDLFDFLVRSLVVDPVLVSLSRLLLWAVVL
jgi:hypothetical protein